MEYEPVIGLETHVQLKTKSKMWCGCPDQLDLNAHDSALPLAIVYISLDS